MPRIPERGRVLPIRPEDVVTSTRVATAPLRQAAQAFGAMSDSAFQLEEARRRAKAQIELNNALLGFQSGMDDLALAGEQETDPDALRQKFGERSASLLSQARESIRDPEAKLAFEERALRLHEERRIRTEARSIGLLQDQVRVSTDARALQLAQAAANETDPVLRQAKIDEGMGLYRSAFQAGALNAGQAAAGEQGFLGMVEKSDIILGTGALQAARSGAEADAIALGLAKRIATATALDPVEKARAEVGLAQDLRITKDRLVTQAERFDRERQEKAADGWVTRILGAPLEQLPSAQEILADPNLSPSAKEHFVELSAARAKGANTEVTNPALANELYRRIHDESAPNRITSFSEVLPFVGSGISTAFAEQLREDLGAQSKTRSSRFSDFLKSAKPQITKTTLMANDPNGERLYYEFTVEARKRWTQAVERGQDPTSLLDPQSKDFLGNLIPQYQRSMEQQAQDLSNLFQPPAQREAVPVRGKDESPEEYLRRIGK